MATTVVLGGGVGGLVTARELRKKLGREHRVVLVDKEARHIFWPSLLWLQVGLRRPEAIVKDLAPLESKGIEVIKGEVEAIDPPQKTVRVGGQELQADYLVVSLGAHLAPEQLPSLSEPGHTLYDPCGAPATPPCRVRPPPAAELAPLRVAGAGNTRWRCGTAKRSARSGDGRRSEAQFGRPNDVGGPGRLLGRRPPRQSGPGQHGREPRGARADSGSQSRRVRMATPPRNEDSKRPREMAAATDPVPLRAARPG